ncbi:MAG: deoxyribose-phosphate aldolase [Proteobacteria bacterium]|nr:deoxyribose-phosphate aldolase [Pseudomonadota bacterium]
MTSKLLKSFNENYDKLVHKFDNKVITRANIASYIDHTLLKPEATSYDIRKLCTEAKEYKFKAVCVNPYYVRLASQELRGTGIEIASVVGFPLGATPGENKIVEAKRAIDNGATEIDMVINIGALKDSNTDMVRKKIEGIVSLGVTTKVIIEICLLSDKEKVIATQIAKDAGASFVKTSTGFSKGGATLRDVALLKYIAGEEMKVKAAGGIRNFATAQAMIFAGADRIGASRSVDIVKGG